MNNKLVEHLRSKMGKGGIIKTQGMDRRDVIQGHFFRMQTEDGDKMFCKYVPSKIFVDAEVLMSEIYSRMGIKTPTYLPFREGMNWGVVSEDVQSKDNTAKTALEVMTKNIVDTGDYLTVLDMDLETVATTNVWDHLLKKYAKNDIVHIGNMDVASGNIDRNISNMFFGDYDGRRYGSVISFDYGGAALGFINPTRYQDMKYDILPTKTTRVTNTIFDTYIHDMTHIKNWYDCVTPEEFIKKLDRIDVASVASDIKNTTGYEIDPRYIAYIQDRYNRFVSTTADMLIFTH